MITFSDFSCEYEYLGSGNKRELSINKSRNYKVYINDKEIPVYTCRMSKFPMNQEWRGYQRPIEQSEIHSFVNIIGNETISVKVKIENAKDRVRVKPYSKNIFLEKKGDYVFFTIKENGYYVLENGDCHDSLLIMYSSFVPIEGKPTYYFGKGVHFAGKIVLKSNESLYLDKDAYVYGSVFAENASDLKIYGNGIIDDGTEERVCANAYEKFTNGNLKFYDCNNIIIKGVGIANSAIWCVNLFHCFSVIMDELKVFGQWRYNTDGIDIVNSQYISIKNSLIQSFDDSITLKGIERYKDTDCAYIRVDNCVLQCDWGKTLEVGLETRCKEMYDISFNNCDILRAGNTACDIQNGDYAFIHDVIFNDVRIEIEKEYTMHVYQQSFEEKYPEKAEFFPICLLKIFNRQFNNERIVAHNLNDFDDNAATVDNIVAKNITVFFDEDVPKVDDKYNCWIDISSHVRGKRYKKVVVENVVINGSVVSGDDIKMSVADTDEFVWEK